MWIVDIDGRGLCAVASEGEGRNVRLYEGTREGCERFISSARETPRKRGRKPRKGNLPTVAARPVAGDTVPVAVKDETVAYSEAETRYAQGFYREVCRSCGKPITRTGARGRAPIYHAECRPTESE